MRFEQVVARVTLVLVGSIAFACEPQAAHAQICIVHLHNRQDNEVLAGSKLSPVMIALADSGGLLRGYDSAGAAIIEVSHENVQRLRDSQAVNSVQLDEFGATWEPVIRLKVSYVEKLSPVELKRIGVRSVEEYDKGSFLVAEPLSNRIDGVLARAFEQSPHVRYVTPIIRAKVIETSDGR